MGLHQVVFDPAPEMLLQGRIFQPGANLFAKLAERSDAWPLMLFDLDDMEAVAGLHDLGNLAAVELGNRRPNLIENLVGSEGTQLAAFGCGLVVRILTGQFAEILAGQSPLAKRFGLLPARRTLVSRRAGIDRDQNLRQVEAFVVDRELLRMGVVIGLYLLGRDADFLAHSMLDH